MKTINLIVAVLIFLVVTGCAYSPVVRQPENDGLHQGYYQGPNTTKDREMERNRMLRLYGAGDFDQIYSALRGYLSAGSHNFIGDLIYSQPAMSLCFAAVALEKNDGVLFNDVLWIAQANEKDPNSLIQLRYMRQARDTCGYKATEAIRVYFRNGRKSAAVKPIIHACPALAPFFRGY